MITDNQVKKLKRKLGRGKSLVISALQAGMDGKTARKYRNLDKLPGIFLFPDGNRFSRIP